MDRARRLSSYFARMLASALARRIVYVVVAALLALIGIERAHANVDYPDQGAAYAGCRAALSQNIASDPVRRSEYAGSCAHQPPAIPTVKGSYNCQFQSTNSTTGNVSVVFCSAGGGRFHYYPGNQSCEAKGGYTGTGPWSSIGGGARSGSLGCRGGCDGQWDKNADNSYTWTPTGGTCPDDEKKNCELLGGGMYWNPVLKVCEPPQDKCVDGKPPNSLGQCGPEPCPSGTILQADGTCKKKESECPAGNVRSPDGRCLPGDGQCAEGEVRGPDGTCKKDHDGDGEPDPQGEGESNSFSGGDDCNAPPSCSGDAIMCGQARIQWRIDCNTRKNRNIAGGSCNAMPVCTGEKCDALEYTQLLMQWRTACAIEKLKVGEGGGNDGTQPEWTKVGGMSQDPGAGASANDTKVLTTTKLDINDLDQSGFGGGGGCIGFAVGGASGMSAGYLDALASPPAFFCDYIALIKAIIILSAAVTCAYILTSGGKT